MIPVGTLLRLRVVSGTPPRQQHNQVLPRSAVSHAIVMVLSAVVCVSWRRLSDDVREAHSLAGADSAAARHAEATDVAVELPPVRAAPVVESSEKGIPT